MTVMRCNGGVSSPEAIEKTLNEQTKSCAEQHVHEITMVQTTQRQLQLATVQITFKRLREQISRPSALQGMLIYLYFLLMC